MLLNEQFVYIFNDSSYAKTLAIPPSFFVKNPLIDESSEEISINPCEVSTKSHLL